MRLPVFFSRMRYLFPVLLFMGVIFSFSNPAIAVETGADVAGTVDAGFNVGVGANSYVADIELRSDGKIVLGGTFTGFSGVARGRVAQLSSGGELDMAFNTISGVDATVTAIALQPDGKLLLVGFFTKFNGVNVNRIVRLNIDGSIDASFNIGTGPNGFVSAVALQPDGKILIGGNFSSVNGIGRSLIARLNPDGSLDHSFNPGAGFYGTAVMSIAVQPDGKLIAGGVFSQFNGSSVGGIARLNPGGSLDADFNVGIGANSQVFAVALQRDGKIVVGGNFTEMNGVASRGIARLNVDGTLDPTFNTGAGVAGAMYAVAFQPDQKMLIVGAFSSVDSIARSHVARLNPDGTLDPGFTPGSGANSSAMSVVLQPDGKAVISGTFTEYNGQPAGYIVRIHTGDKDQDGVEDASDWFDNAAAAADTDQDGKPDAWLEPNAFACAATASTCNGLALDVDDDNDGVPDYIDADPLNDAINTERLLPLNDTYKGSAIREGISL
jgi:uncharacterized delta-60 repeat protein